MLRNIIILIVYKSILRSGVFLCRVRLFKNTPPPILYRGPITLVTSLLDPPLSLAWQNLCFTSAFVAFRVHANRSVC
jgi:hypothetical protein